MFRLKSDRNNFVLRKINKNVKESFVTDAPQWISQLQPQTNIDLSSSAEMRCEAAADPPADYVWLRDGARLSNNNKYNIVDHNGGSVLTLRDATADDARMYQCVAHNDNGYIFSSTKLNVVCKY